MNTVLYITQNGITDHIGQSQIAPYLTGLAKLKYRIHILSAEKPERSYLLDQYSSQFSDVRIYWTRVTYLRRPRLIAHALTILQLYWKALNIIRKDEIRILHCRSFLPAMIGFVLKKQFGLRLIFDFRDFSADGGMLKARGLERIAYQIMKYFEGTLIKRADKVVCLTDKARNILLNWYFPHEIDAKRLFEVIPCCADFDHFSPEKISKTDLALIRNQLGIMTNDKVLLYLGSLGPDYLLDEMLCLFRQLLIINPHSRFLFLVNNGKDLVESKCRRHNIDLNRIILLSVGRDEIPTFISLADFSVFFIRPDLSKAGCSPTKLAELFALNIPVIANSGVGDLDFMLNLERNGSTLVNGFSEFTMREAIGFVLCRKRGDPVLIRENSRHLDLQFGIGKYGKVYSELLANDLC